MACAKGVCVEIVSTHTHKPRNLAHTQRGQTMKEIKRYDQPIRNSSTYDHVVDIGDNTQWYVGVREYSVDPRYTKSGTWEDHAVSENMAKIENGKVVWCSEDLSDYELCNLNFRLTNLLKGGIAP